MARQYVIGSTGFGQEINETSNRDFVVLGEEITETQGTTGYTLAAGAGSFTLSGQDVGLLKATLMSAESGAFTFTGQDVGLVYAVPGSYSLAAGSGSFSLTGQDVALKAGYAATAGAGSFTLTGQAVTLTYSGAIPSTRRRSRGYIIG
jgi:hypothetical protein